LKILLKSNKNFEGTTYAINDFSKKGNKMSLLALLKLDITITLGTPMRWITKFLLT